MKQILLILSLYLISSEAFTPIDHRASSSITTTVVPTISLKSTLNQDQESTGWTFRGHHVHTEVKKPKQKKQDWKDILLFNQLSSNNNKPSILLVHGFGCSTTYWRKTTTTLVNEGYEVHSIDLLGQGKSAKPGRDDGVEYSIDLWAALVESYAKENIKKGDVVLAGNSLGSLVVLSAITGAFSGDTTTTTTELFLKNNVKGICMFNCGVGLNSRGIAKEPRWNPIQRQLINTLYDILSILIFNNRLLLTYVLDKVVTPELLLNTLQSLYKYNPSNVDDELVQSFYLPSKDNGSVEALSQIYCNDPGPTPYELHDKHNDFLNNLPIHLVWGDDDAITPIEGGVGQFYLSLANDEVSDNNISFYKVKSGHVPFDDNPDESNGSFINWLNEKVV